MSFLFCVGIGILVGAVVVGAALIFLAVQACDHDWEVTSWYDRVYTVNYRPTGRVEPEASLICSRCGKHRVQVLAKTPLNDREVRLILAARYGFGVDKGSKRE